MDTIFSSCKRGDLERVKYFVEKKEVDVNATDSWDSTPLYYACLCGYFDIVQYLLEHGARCEEGSRDGERCVYGALTKEIREFLLNSSIVTRQSKVQDEYQGFCERMWKSEETPDFQFVIGDSIFKVHRCILCTRSEYFRRKFQNEWEHRTSVGVTSISPALLEILLQYIYTGRVVCPKDLVEQLCLVAELCGFFKLKLELESAMRIAKAFEVSKAVNISKIIAESQKLLWDVQQDFGFLVSLGLPQEYCSWTPSFELPLMSTPSPYFDLCICVDGKEYYCHKVFMTMRSAYFACLLRDHFNESCYDKNMTHIVLHEISGPAFASVLHFIYTNNAEFISEDTVYDLLERADMYLLPGLKRLCGNFLTSTTTVDNVVSILKISRFYELPKLEDFCTNFMAKEIESLVDNTEFEELIISDANEVHDRQDIDSIPVIDDIRLHITMCVQTFSQVETANQKLRVIDSILEKLKLDA